MSHSVWRTVLDVNSLLKNYSPCLLAALLKQLGDQRGPSGLMAGPDAGAIVAVKILVEEDVIAEVRIGLKFLRATEYRPPAMLVAQEQMR